MVFQYSQSWAIKLCYKPYTKVENKDSCPSYITSLHKVILGNWLILNCVLFYSLEKSQCTPLLFFSFFNFLFFAKKVSFIQWGKFAFLYFFLEKQKKKKCFSLIVQNKKKTVFFNVLIFPILSSIIKYCKIEKPENTD